MAKYIAVQKCQLCEGRGHKLIIPGVKLVAAWILGAHVMRAAVNQHCDECGGKGFTESVQAD